VLLDVVYNHFGPDGNYLHAYAPQFFNPRHQTPWGAAINFDGDHSAAVRAFFVHNALYWLEEFHFDGLRLDAVHAIADDSPTHIVAEIAAAIHAGPGRTRAVHLVLENDLNQARFLPRGADGRPQIATAQWNDDIHHAAHVLATGERDGYYADYAEQPVWLFARILAEGFGYQGEPSAYRHGELRGEPSTSLPPVSFINFLQNHDQVGNRALGERIGQFGDRQALRALLACVLLAPSVPMLFMGEEYDASTPFLFFCDFDGELAAAVTRGRREEFGRFARFADPKLRERIPDPNALQTYRSSKLDWAERDRAPHAEWLAYLRDLLSLRREHLLPHLPAARCGQFHVLAPGRMAVHWPLGKGSHLHLLANLADEPAMSDPLPPGRVIHASHSISDGLPPWSVRVSLESAHD